MFSFLFQRSISENSLVAMDFSGQKSRVIDNPTEALSVAVEEGLAWRVQIGSCSLKSLTISVCFTQKVEMFFPFFVQKKACLRLGNHGSPKASSQSSAINMGMSASALDCTAGHSDIVTEGSWWKVYIIKLWSSHAELCIPSLCFFSYPPVPTVVSPQNF